MFSRAITFRVDFQPLVGMTRYIQHFCKITLGIFRQNISICFIINSYVCSFPVEAKSFLELLQIGSISIALVCDVVRIKRKEGLCRQICFEVPSL